MFKKKNKEIVVGSNNDGKIKEIKDLLPKYYIITSPKDYGLKSPKENGNTFLKNSLIKAKYFSKKTKKICIADDSGLEIDLLNNQPGIYSARWAKDFGGFDSDKKEESENGATRSNEYNDIFGDPNLFKNFGGFDNKE
mgnify:CR=1 FL=1